MYELFSHRSCSHSIQIPDNFAGAYGEFCNQFLCTCLVFLPYMSRNPKSPFARLKIATSASDPTLRFPSSGLLITLAGFQVDRRITSCTERPIFRNLDIRLHISFMPLFMLPVWRSELIQSAMKPCLNGRYGLAPEKMNLRHVQHQISFRFSVLQI